ncbi:unnamed protein product [Adineta ricciae]|uniref:EGF-like domain-containing protein n=1 Tax=Adineta ricciae TaxID=249248 RepID=A0A815SIZ2_ADIRI|nr:unnamed protein product [Adineta ricciae]CAF1493161.1 unnamed protein product [Adineta ricciae]
MLTTFYYLFLLSTRTESNSNFYTNSYLQYDCIYYSYSTGFLLPLKIEYCFRSTTDVDLMPIANFINTRDQNYTFHQLFQINVTAYDIFHWSASIDLTKQYQDYFDHHNTSLQANQLFYNCTPPWFGSRCQYFLESDEAACFDLEINECEPNEYRCHNGQCVDDFDECINGRHLMLLESLTVQGSSPDDCWLAMVCLTRLMHPINRTFCNGTSIHPSHLHACDHLIQFPINPVLFGHVHSLYHTCRHAHHMRLPQNTKYHGWKHMIRVIKPYFVGCATRAETSKYISKYRIADNITDCYLNDDEEDHELSCFLDQPHRFKCANESRCRSPILQRLGCPLVENETKTIDSILFNQICDGVVDVSVEVVDGLGHTDETDCEHWPCSNVYSRCDAFWNCRNGEDEEACRASNWSRGLFECMSPLSYTMICLAAYNVRDGTVDCVGGFDEPQLCQGTNAASERLYRFTCLDGRTCVNPFTLCYSMSKLYNKDVCIEWMDYDLSIIQDNICHAIRLERAPFPSETSEVYPAVEKKVIIPNIEPARKPIRVYSLSLHCVRGLPVHLWLGSDIRTARFAKIHSIGIYYTHPDQQIFPKPTAFILMRMTRALHNILLVGCRVPFLFLPVNRLNVLLTLDSRRAMSPSSCSLKCDHGVCMKYANEEKYFCRCNPGWSGTRCHIQTNCSDCSSDSVCVGQIHNRSICICPLGKFGNHCLLKHSCPANYCENNGQCIVTSEQIIDKNYQCLCSEQFQGARCEYPKSILRISFHSLDVSAYLIIYIYESLYLYSRHPQDVILRVAA